jgi:beta-lactamase superfamily II metal-dependent hydrolase
LDGLLDLVGVPGLQELLDILAPPRPDEPPSGGGGEEPPGEEPPGEEPPGEEPPGEEPPGEEPPGEEPPGEDFSVEIISSGPGVNDPIDDLEAVAPATLEFEANVIGGTEPYSYSWDFGDGSEESNEETVEHTFEEAGRYNVALTITDAEGRTASDTDTITITVAGEEPPPGEEPPGENSSAQVTPAIQPSQNLTIVFIDVGQGDSILVILPNTKTLLIDGGQREASGKVLATLQEHGLSRIDVVVATHPHADHIGGLVDVLRNVSVGQVLDSGRSYIGPFFEDFMDAIETKQIPLKSVREGDSINLDPTVRIEVLNPPAYFTTGLNNRSVVLKLTYGEFSALLTGDIQEASEARLVSENSTALDVEVLKAGHHGSCTSSTSSFLNAVTPEIVVISLEVGYGYPHNEALERISTAGTEHLFRTDVDGTITLNANVCSEYSIITEKSMKTVNVSEFEMAIC